MNKHERVTAGKKKAARLARKFGWREPFAELPVGTRRAFESPDELKIPRVNDKKGFSRGTRPNGQPISHLGAKLARQRAALKAGWEEAEMKPNTNGEQRAVGRFVKSPRKNLRKGERIIVQKLDK